VQLLYRNGQRRDVLLAAVPREGDQIRLDNGASSDEAALVVDRVTWLEGAGRGPDPEGISSVHAADK